MKLGSISKRNNLDRSTCANNAQVDSLLTVARVRKMFFVPRVVPVVPVVPVVRTDTMGGDYIRKSMRLNADAGLDHGHAYH